MKPTFLLMLALAVAMCGWRLFETSVAAAATPATTAQYRVSDAAVPVTPVRYYRPYRVYYRPYYRPYVYRPYVYRAYRPYYAPVYPYSYGYAPYPYYGPYYGGGVYFARPRVYAGYRW
jgi:hypothetical protein